MLRPAASTTSSSEYPFPERRSHVRPPSANVSYQPTKSEFVTLSPPLFPFPALGALGFALGLIFCSALPATSYAVECIGSTKQSQLQALSSCTSAICCPRELNRQVNLVRAVAQKLKSLGYTISEPNSPAEDSPDLSGMYYPALRSAVLQYKKDRDIADGNADITYELAAVLLEVNLFERWQ